MSTDPAVDAAQRACEPHAVSHLIGSGRYALLGAREALKPIRELHKRVPGLELADECSHVEYDHPSHFEDQWGEWICGDSPTGDWYCNECRADDGSVIDWPCPTATLVYSAEELREEQ